MPAAVDALSLSAPWQSKLGAPGQVVQGLEAIGESIKTIVRTQVGEVPASDIGVNWLEVLDEDKQIAIPKAIALIARALARHEPRARVTEIREVESEDPEETVFRILWVPSGAEGPTQTTLASV